MLYHTSIPLCFSSVSVVGNLPSWAITTSHVQSQYFQMEWLGFPGPLLQHDFISCDTQTLFVEASTMCLRWCAGLTFNRELTRCPLSPGNPGSPSKPRSPCGRQTRRVRGWRKRKECVRLLDESIDNTVPRRVQGAAVSQSIK